MTDERTFRVIIAGGSVVGLALANALEKAGIDFVVLERGDIAPPTSRGLHFGLVPHGQGPPTAGYLEGYSGQHSPPVVS